MSARDEILARLRATPIAAPPPPAAVGTGAEPVAPRVGNVEAWRRRAVELGARVTATAPGALPATLGRIWREHDRPTLVVPPGLDEAWTTEVRAVGDAPALTVAQLASMEAVLTGCAAAIAATGSIVLDHGPAQGRRALTLLPDLHLCVVAAEQVVADVPDALALLAPTLARARPVTFVTGPSATSDIELERVQGVHGPRRLELVLVTAATPA